jgi:hypothetical protein
MLVPITIVVTTFTTHNIQIPWMVHHIQTTPLSKDEVPLNQIPLQNYMLEIHHGWTFWFQGKRTTRLGANVSPIVSHLGLIFEIPSQMWITMEENLRLVLLCGFKKLCLLGARRAKPFANWHSFHWWHETSHMPTLRTLITNQHSGIFWSLPTQHTL